MAKYDYAGREIVDVGKGYTIVISRDGTENLVDPNKKTIAWYVPWSNATYKPGYKIGTGNILKTLIK